MGKELLKNGMTIGKAKVVVDIVDKGNREIRPEIAMNPTEIAIHNTGNSGKGANAKAHNVYIHNMAKLSPKDTGYASWHLSVDHVNIYQHIPFDETAWHTGDGSGKNSGNMNAIGIEICENSDMTAEEYKQAEENAVALSVILMEMFNIGIKKVKPHQTYSGKFCPRVILKRDGSFDKFSKRIEVAYGNKNQSAKKDSDKKESAKEVVKEKPKAETPKETVKETPKKSSTLKKGSKGAEVEALQKLLNKYGYTLKADGDFGANTDKQVKAFQKANGLTVDGIVGEKTLAKLKSDLSYGKATGDVWLHSKADLTNKTRTEVLAKGSVVQILSGGNDSMYKTQFGYVSKKYIKKEK